MALTPEQQNEIRNQVTKMVYDGRSDAEIQAWKNNYLESVKTAPPVDQTGTPVEGAPTGGDSVSDNTSSELPKESKNQTYGDFSSSWLERRLGREENEEDYLGGQLGGIVNSIPWIGDIIDDGARALGTGRAQARLVDDALKMFGEGEDIDPEVLADYYARAQELQNQPMSDEMKAFNQIYEEAGEGVWGFLKATALEPQAIPETIISSLAAMINPSSALGAGIAAGAGAGAGSVIPGVGTALGAIGGATGGASAVLDAALSFNEFLQEELGERGLNFDEEGIKELYKDQEAIDKIRMRAAGRGAAIGLIDGLTAGVAGKIGGAAAKTWGAVYAGPAAFATEAAGGGVGEATGRLVAGQEMDAREIGLEILGEFGQALPVAKQVATQIKHGAEINGQPVSPKNIDKFIGTPESNFSDVKIKNPEVQKQADVNKYSVDPEENKDLITPEEAQAREELINKIDELGPMWRKGNPETKKIAEQELGAYRKELQDLMAKQGERISYLNPDQQKEFQSLRKKSEKLQSDINLLEKDSRAPEGIAEKKKQELEEVNGQINNLYNESETLLQNKNVANQQKAQKAQATKEKNAQEAAEEAGVAPEEEVAPDPIAEKQEELKSEIVNDDIDAGQKDSDSIEEFMNGFGLLDESRYRQSPSTSVENFSPLGRLGENLSEGDMVKRYKGYVDTEPDYNNFKKQLEKMEIQNGWSVSFNDKGKVDGEGRPLVDVEIRKQRKEGLSEQVAKQMESEREAAPADEEAVVQDEAQQEEKAERAPVEAAIEYAQSTDRNQGGEAYEGPAPVETEDGGVLYPGLKYTSKEAKKAGVFATIGRMEKAGFRWKNPKEAFSITDEGIKINPADAPREPSDFEFSVAENEAIDAAVDAGDFARAQELIEQRTAKHQEKLGKLPEGERLNLTATDQAPQESGTPYQGERKSPERLVGGKRELTKLQKIIKHLKKARNLDTAPKVQNFIKNNELQQHVKFKESPTRRGLEQQLQQEIDRLNSIEGVATKPKLAEDTSLPGTKHHNDLRGVQGKDVEINIGLENNPETYDQIVQTLKNNPNLILGTTKGHEGTYTDNDGITHEEKTLVVGGKYTGGPEAFKSYMNRLSDRLNQNTIPFTLTGEGVNLQEFAHKKGYKPTYSFDPAYFERAAPFQNIQPKDKAYEGALAPDIADTQGGAITQTDRKAIEKKQAKGEYPATGIEGGISRAGKKGPILQHPIQSEQTRNVPSSFFKEGLASNIATRVTGYPATPIGAEGVISKVERENENLMIENPKRASKDIKDLVDKFNNLRFDVRLAKELKGKSETSPEHQKMIDSIKTLRPLIADVNRVRELQGQLEDATKNSTINRLKTEIDSLNGEIEADIANNSALLGGLRGTREHYSSDKTPSPFSGPPKGQYVEGEEGGSYALAEESSMRNADYRLTKSFQNDIVRAMNSVNPRTGIKDIEFVAYTDKNGKNVMKKGTLNPDTVKKYNADKLGFKTDSGHEVSSKEVLARNFMVWARGVASSTHGHLTPDKIGAANLGVAKAIYGNDKFASYDDMISKVKNAIVKEIDNLSRNRHGDVVSSDVRTLGNKIRRAEATILSNEDKARNEGKVVPFRDKAEIDDVEIAKEINPKNIKETDLSPDYLSKSNKTPWEKHVANIHETRNRIFSQEATNPESQIPMQIITDFVEDNPTYFDTVPQNVVSNAANNEGLGAPLLGDRFKEVVDEVSDIIKNIGIIPDREGIHRKYGKSVGVKGDATKEVVLPTSKRGKKLPVDSKVDQAIAKHNKQLDKAINKVVTSALDNSVLRTKQGLFEAITGLSNQTLSDYVFGKSRDLKDPNNFNKFKERLVKAITAEAEVAAIVKDHPETGQSLAGEVHANRARSAGQKVIPGKKGKVGTAKPAPAPEGTPWAAKREALIKSYEAGKTIPSDQFEFEITELGDKTNNLDTPGNERPALQVNSKGDNLVDIDRSINRLEEVLIDPDFTGWTGIVTGSHGLKALRKGRTFKPDTNTVIGYKLRKVAELADLLDLKVRENTEGADGYFYVYEPGTPPDNKPADNFEYSLDERGAKSKQMTTDFRNAVTDALNKAWPDYKVTYDKADWKAGMDLITMKGVDLKGGTLKGFLDKVSKTVYVGPHATFETPIHELGHVWEEQLRIANPELWKRGRDLLKGSDYARAVYNIPKYRSYLKNEPSRFWGEVMANALGKRGAVLFNNKKKAKIWDKWMDQFSGWIKDKLNISSKKDYKDLTLDDWLNVGVHGIFEGKKPIPPTAETTEYSFAELDSDPDASPDVAAAKLEGEKVDWRKIGWLKIPRKLSTLLVPPQAEDYHGLISGLKNPKQYAEVYNKYMDAQHKFLDRSTEARGKLKDAINALKKSGVKLSDKAATLEGNDLTVAQALQAEVDGRQVKWTTTPSKKKAIDSYANKMKNFEVDGETYSVLNPSKGKRDYSTASPDADRYALLEDSIRPSTFQEFNKEKDFTFSPAVMQNIRKTKGNLFADALESSLQRMETGKSGVAAPDGTTSKWNQWALGSVSNIMFLNFRSAALQLLSVGNYAFESGRPGKFLLEMFNPANLSEARKLWNDSYLKERKARAGFDVNAADAMELLGNSGTFGSFTKKLLNFGFAATSAVDRTAISWGGAAFMKAGGTRKAWIEASEAAQQSSRADRVSQWQTSGVARYVLAFANTPQQYFRLALQAGREIRQGKNVTGNLAKIGYYMAVQNLLFSSMQAASYALLGIDDEKEEEEALGIINSAAGTILRGMGLYGAILDSLKNVLVEKYRQENYKTNPDYVASMMKAASISPPLNRKLSELRQIGQAYQYGEDNANATALLKGTAVATNLPTDWGLKKYEAAKNLWDSKFSNWQKILMMAGFSEWTFRDNGDINFDDLDFESFDNLDFEDLDFD